MLVLTLLALICNLILCQAVEYHEQLNLHPLQSAVLAAFEFHSNTSLTAFEEQNYNLFPRSLGQILQHTNTKELHLRFSLGRWDDTWGARPRGGRNEGGTGVELWAWVEAATDEEANARWLTLTNALSGLFCASLNFIDSTKTIRPRFSFDLEGTPPKQDNLHLLHGALPHEVVCTENLTPFLKLLPCKGKAGVSSLLDGHKLFDASWQAMAVDIRQACAVDGSECTVEIDQTVDMVLDMERSMRPSKDPIPRPPPVEEIACNTSKSYHGDDTCFPEIQSGERSWSLQKVFGTVLKGSCPLGQQIQNGLPDVRLHVPEDRTVTINSTAKVKQAHIPGDIRAFNLPVGADVDIDLQSHAAQQSAGLLPPPLHAHRTFTGYGQERGGVLSVLTNPSLTETVELVYLESLPWFMKPYLHTLRATISPESPTTSSASSSPVVKTLYRPGIDRQRGTHLELLLTIPPASSVTLTYDFEKSILRYTEYPPDANRGFDVAPAIIRILSPSSSSDATDSGRRSTYLRTTSLLLPLPTPDFSMPYNVIILTSTVLAMGFGSVFNLLTRRLVAADEVEGGGLLFVLKQKVQERIGLWKGRIGKTEVDGSVRKEDEKGQDGVKHNGHAKGKKDR